MKDFEVVISGVSGAFPRCNNLHDLEQKIFTKENLVKEENSKWKTREIPWQLGQLNETTYFDETFFGIHRRLASVLDPHMKQSFEKVYEAIIDAGKNPQELYGSDTAVIMNSFLNETEGDNLFETSMEHLMIGYSRCMHSNRISYVFNFKGPSYTLTGSWEGALQGLSIAHNLIKKGYIKEALVGATNVIFYPQISQLFQDLGTLNEDGQTKSFSADADGYSRSEGIVVFFLQRAEDAIRSYGSIVKILTQAHMNNKSGMIDPSGYSEFLSEFYSNAPIKSTDLAYIEGNGCASLRNDAMELNALSEVLCPGRSKPLPVTCCKSKLGHCESSSPFISIVSALIAMKTGYIPPVLHYTKPNPLVPALKDGSIKIVTEKTPLEGDYIGVSVIGLISTFGHILIKRNPRSQPIKANKINEEGIPRLFLLSGRNEAVMKSNLSKILHEDLDNSYYFLNHMLFRKELPKHLYRGFSIKGENKNNYQVSPYPGGAKRPVWYIFSGMGSQWPEMGRGLMKIPIIRESIERSHQILLPKGVDLISIITTICPRIYNNILNCFVGIAAIQIALVDLLEELGVEPDGIVGHSVGELGCGYADKCLTAEQMLLAAYARGKASNDATLIKGLMAAVGKGWKEIENDLPDGIEVACHNSQSSCTLSGPADLMESYVNELQAKGVFAKLVNSSNIAYHSKNIAPAGPFLLQYLKEIIPEPKMRSSKWISSSVPESQWKTDLALYCSAEYQTNNLLSHVLFEEASEKIPENAICIEVAPHGLLQAIVKKSHPKCSHIPLTRRAQEGCDFTIEALAFMFCCGIDMDVTKMYPKVECPLPRETEYLHHLVTWNHSEQWIHVSCERDLENRYKFVNHKTRPLFNEPGEGFFISTNHCISGKPTFPIANLLIILIDSLFHNIKEKMSSSCYDFQYLKFFENFTLDQKITRNLDIVYLSGSGRFEISFESKVLMQGLINPATSLPNSFLNHHILPLESHKNSTHISQENIYTFFAEHDYIFNEQFKNISDIRITDEGFIGRVKWRCSTQFYFDAILKLIILHSSITKDRMMEIESIGQILYDSSLLPQEEQEIFVFYDENLDELSADGVRMLAVKTKPTNNSKICGKYIMEKQVFVPYSSHKSLTDFIEACFQIVIASAGSEKITVIGNDKSSIFQTLLRSNYFNVTAKSKRNIRVSSFDTLNTVPLIDPPSKSDIILIISDENLSDSIKNLIEKLYENCYLIQHASSTNIIKGFRKLEPVLEKIIDNRKIIFCKKNIDPFMDGNFTQVPGGFLLGKPDDLDQITSTKKSDFLIFRYRNLSDINEIIEASRDYYSMKNSRFVFTDEKPTSFDFINDFYLKQFKKDLKMNVCHNGVWGSLRDVTETFSLKPYNQFKESQLPLNNIKTDGVDLKVLGLNMQTFINPTMNLELGLFEYVGIQRVDKEVVMGIGKLTPDNSLHLDPTLVWKKPESWSMQQAATVPLFYSMAYHLLFKGNEKSIKDQNILIQGGHTAFSQAYINVALKHEANVHTTCFTHSQKKLILKTFPQLLESNVHQIEMNCSITFSDHIVESTKGEGFDLIIDCLEVDNFLMRIMAMNCIGEWGKYFVICHNNMKSDHTFGMRVFMNKISVHGFNPDLMLDLSGDEKEKIAKMVEEGIKGKVVKPLKNLYIDGTSTRRQAIQSIVSSNKEEEVKKVLIDLEKTPESVSNIKNYLIIGDTKSLWLEMINWLASWGAKNIFVVLERSSILDHIQMRLNVFMKANPHIYIRFIDIETFKSKERFEETIQRINTLDKAFYISSDVQDDLELLDSVLRKLYPKSWLVSIGNKSNKYLIEKRNKEGFKTISFIFKKETLKVRSIINALDHWLRSFQLPSEQFIRIDETYDENIATNDPEILPQTVGELTDLAIHLADKPHFIEVSTLTPPKKYIKGLDPVFFFPGFKVSKTRNLISKLSYPSYIAKYPSSMKSLDEVAEQFSQEMVKNFDMYMLTLVAEGWAGPLVLRVANRLESEGRICAVILIDAIPSSVKRWSKELAKSNGILKNCISSNTKQEEITVGDIKKGSNRLVSLVSKDNQGDDCLDEVRKGLDALINRLELTNSTQDITGLHIESKVHFFTAKDDLLINHSNTSELNEICRVPCSLHLINDTTSENILESKQLLTHINNLVLLEYKSANRKQNIVRISTLDPIDLLHGRL